MLALQQGAPSGGDHSHDDFKAVPQEVRRVLSLLTVLSSLEKGQDQNDEKLREEKRSVSGNIHPQRGRGAFPERKRVGEQRARSVCDSSDPRGRELATCTLELPESSVLY